MKGINTLDIRFIKFLIVGGINTIFGYSVFALLIYLGLHFSLAALLGTIIGVAFNFNTYGRLVFESHDNSKILKFVGVYTIVYFLNVIGLWAFNQVGINYYLGGAILILPVGIVGFILNKSFVFNTN